MDFRITGLSPEPFRHLYGLSDVALAAVGARRCTVDAKPGFPDRVELRDGEPGETMLLLNFTHQPAASPYRASHAIFVREGAERAFDASNEIPEVLRIRTLSVRAFDQAGDMLDADLVEGRELEGVIERMFQDSAVAYLQLHYAKRGCYAARVDR
jgi:hypothetical protein